MCVWQEHLIIQQQSSMILLTQTLNPKWNCMSVKFKEICIDNPRRTRVFYAFDHIIQMIINYVAPVVINCPLDATKELFMSAQNTI